MRTHRIKAAGRIFLLSLLLHPALALAESCIAGSPQLYGDLFEDVQRVLPDAKAFVDATPKQPPAGIAAEYAHLHGVPGFDLNRFIADHFTLPRPAGGDYRTDPDHDVREHIDALWQVLERKPEPGDARTTLLPLPHRYIVPGGRFNEIYYWDSYFTMLGLEESGRHDVAVDMVKNFAWLIDHYGHIPNGNRTYFLSRSQPPFFAAMVNLLAAARRTVGADRRTCRSSPREYEFWMQGGDGARARAGAPARGAADRWRVAQPLLGRLRHAA